MSPGGAGAATLASLAVCARFAGGALRGSFPVPGARVRFGAGARECGSERAARQRL